MLQLSYLFLLVASSYGQQNTTQVRNSFLDSVLVDQVPAAKLEDVANETLSEIITTTPNSESETDTSYKAPTGFPCTEWFLGNGTCVPLPRCNMSSLYEDNFAYAHIRNIEPGCSEFEDVCCPPAYIILDSPVIEPDVIGNQFNKSCGHRNPEGVGLNLTAGDKEGGSLSVFGEFPWMVAVLRNEPIVDKEPEGQRTSAFLGGGSLIHPSVVLTAAHVVYNEKELRVRAGEWHTHTTKEMYPHQDRNVKEVVLHPEFNPKNLHNDIALLFLSDSVDISPLHIGVVCLSNLYVEDTVSESQCLASGWGKDQFGKEGRYSVLLKKVELPLVDHGTCEERLRGTRLGTRFRLDSSFMCAGGEAGKDTCIGDGGAPLVCPVKDDKDKYVQNGIAAWGIGCGEEGIPGVYAYVATFLSWIDENVVRHGYDPKIYTI